MEIVSLQIKNFMSIKDAELKLGQINQIVGLNSQGKTTILKAIETAAKGSTDGSLVKFGEDKAEIILELPDQTIRRTLNNQGKQTVNISKGEFKVQSPQTYLEGLFDFSAFNPLELLEPKRRTEAIMKSIDLKVSPELISEKTGIDKDSLPPIDFSQHGLKVVEDFHKYYFGRRAEANKATVEKKNRFETYKKDLKEITAPTVSRMEISQQRDALDKDLTSADGLLAIAKTRADQFKDDLEKLKKYQTELQNINTEISDLQVKAAALQERKENGLRVIENIEGKVKDAPDLAPFQKAVEDIKLQKESLKTQEREIEAFEAVNKQQEMIGAMELEYKTALQMSENLDKTVGILAGDLKRDLMASSEMPIKGLEYKDGNFLIDGTPVDNLSSSMALKLAISVARKLAKKTKIICIDGSEMLDEESYKTLISEIKDDGFTYFITRVGSGVEGVNNITMSQGQVQ